MELATITTIKPTSAMNELRTHLAFTQLRFYRSKRQGRTFHVTTVTDSIGEAVVEYFSGQTDVQPEPAIRLLQWRMTTRD